MKNFLLIALLGYCFLCHFDCLSQVKEIEHGKQYSMESTDFVIVNASIKKSSSLKEFNLGTFFHPKMYRLSSIEIDSILFIYDSSSFIEDQQLSTKYLLFRKEVMFKQDSSYCISFCQTTYPNLFLFGRFVPLEEQKSRNYYYHAIIRSFGINNRRLKKFINCK